MSLVDALDVFWNIISNLYGIFVLMELVQPTKYQISIYIRKLMPSYLKKWRIWILYSIYGLLSKSSGALA